jgi:hypothetical protein
MERLRRWGHPWKAMKNANFSCAKIGNGWDPVLRIRLSRVRITRNAVLR